MISDNKLLKDEAVAVIGLGYVGLPLAVRLAEHYLVLGFDTSEARIKELSRGEDITAECTQKELQNPNLRFFCEIEQLREAQIFIVTVPTPIDEDNTPDLSALKEASRMIGQVMREGAIIVYESTVYPGATREICIPELEEQSGLSLGKDFEVGYSPERVSPGVGGKQIHEISKVVSGTSKDTETVLCELYKNVTEEKVHIAPSIEVAEFSKVLENTQRDLNIALINEVSHICFRMGIRTKDVLEAAGTKWNFNNYFPGLVGGHCIGVDPYYLLLQSMRKGYLAVVITAGRRVNEKMSSFVAKRVLLKIAKAGLVVKGAELAVFGLTFKENCPDFRNSKVFDLIDELREYGFEIDGFDPYGDLLSNSFSCQIEKFPVDGRKYDGVILAVPHSDFVNIGQDYYKNLLRDSSRGVIFDIMGCFGSGEFEEL